MEQWTADVDLPVERAAELIATQFPSLAPRRMERLGRGWDNDAYLVNDEYVFRFVRRDFAAQFLEHETLWLPWLAPQLPIAVPVPEYVGSPTDDYPHRFAGYRRVAGRLGCGVTLDDQQQVAAARALGEFLRALHSLPVISVGEHTPPGDLIGRADIASRMPRMLDRLRELPAPPEGLEIARAIELTAAAVELPPWEGGPVWCHGDLYARHILFDDAGPLCGAIDWGDVHVGDPALDLSIAWTFLPRAARPAFREAYGEIDDATWQRARLRALSYAGLLVPYGLDIDDADLVAAGWNALRHATE